MNDYTDDKVQMILSMADLDDFDNAQKQHTTEETHRADQGTFNHKLKSAAFRLPTHDNRSNTTTITTYNNRVNTTTITTNNYSNDRIEMILSMEDLNDFDNDEEQNTGHEAHRLTQGMINETFATATSSLGNQHSTQQQAKAKRTSQRIDATSRQLRILARSLESGRRKQELRKVAIVNATMGRVEKQARLRTALMRVEKSTRRETIEKYDSLARFMEKMERYARKGFEKRFGDGSIERYHGQQCCSGHLHCLRFWIEQDGLVLCSKKTPSLSDCSRQKGRAVRGWNESRKHDITQLSLCDRISVIGLRFTQTSFVIGLPVKALGHG